MDVWISFYNTHMANNIVKWWRNKFLNGYKHFSDCSDVRVSDTEELLGKYNSEDEHLEKTPTQQYQETGLDSQKEDSPVERNNSNKIFEKMFCNADGSKNEAAGAARIDKQQFSFTLYDFDGHGQITKDDIAGLVTTIYEALGSSLKVPHAGSKTIKIKVTVSPEQNVATPDNKRYKKDINITIRQGINHRCRHTKQYCCQQQHRQQQQNNSCNNHDKNNEHDNLVSDEFSDVSSGSFSDKDDDDEKQHNCSDSDNIRKSHGTKRKKYTKRRYATTATLPFLNNCEAKCAKKKGRYGSSSLQRRELLGIIQANMEKKTSFHTNRKQCFYEEKPEKSKKNESTKAFQQYLANIVEPSRFYVDLASLQNACEFPTNYDKLINAVIDVSRKTYVNARGKRRKKIDWMNSTSDVRKNNEQVAEKMSKKTVTGHTSSPHYLKHRNRQEDQARAMAQVVRWLEREFSTNLTIKEKLERVKHTSRTTESENGASNVKKSDKYEHHHIHEHIHHHYHHYRDEPFVI